jgi:hypothetical protein
MFYDQFEQFFRKVDSHSYEGFFWELTDGSVYIYDINFEVHAIAAASIAMI